MQTQLAGQIARALAVFCVDEVVIFDDGQNHSREYGTSNGRKPEHINTDDSSKYTGFSNPNIFLARLLSYLECPQYLRRSLFPGFHPDLSLAGTLPSLDMPHHMRSNEWCQYREGVTCPASERVDKDVTPVMTGLKREVHVPGDIPENSRITLKFASEPLKSKKKGDALSADVVAPYPPREQAGYYWGYNIRAASSLSAVMTECPFDGGYDLTFGTSERGDALSSVASKLMGTAGHTVEPCGHILVVFGGVAGLEVAFKADAELQGKPADVGPKDLFDFWVNACPGQGSRTIRTEEALWIVLSGLREVVATNR